MNKRKELNRYIKMFTNDISQYIKNKASVSVEAYPVEGDGAVFEFVINDKPVAHKVQIHKAEKSLQKALSHVEQNLIDGDLDNVSFSGTNLLLDGNRIIIIKGGNNQDSWSNRAILEDVKKIVSPRVMEEVNAG